MDKHINIKFPFKDSQLGYYFDSNTLTTDAIKSDILHVLLTQKGERFLNPNFGTNLYKFLFEPNDDITLAEIKDEANSSLNYCMPNVQITKLESEISDNSILLTIVAQNTDDLFLEDIFIQVQI